MKIRKQKITKLQEIKKSGDHTNQREDQRNIPIKNAIKIFIHLSNLYCVSRTNSQRSVD